MNLNALKTKIISFQNVDTWPVRVLDENGYVYDLVDIQFDSENVQIVVTVTEHEDEDKWNDSIYVIDWDKKNQKWVFKCTECNTSERSVTCGDNIALCRTEHDRLYHLAEKHDIDVHGEDGNIGGTDLLFENEGGGELPPDYWETAE